jgi:hypothetical protein
VREKVNKDSRNIFKTMGGKNPDHLSWYGETDVQSVPDFSKLIVIAAGEEILQQQLVLGNPKTESFY